MDTTRLLTVLRRSGLELTPTEVAEALWLAAHAGPFTGPPARPAPRPEPAAPSEAARTEWPDEGERGGQLPVRLPALRAGPGGTAAGVAIRGPDAPALARTAGIARALRPFKRRVASARELVLDETATARRIAEGGIWIPVLTAAPERWFDVALVVDAAESVLVWSALVTELRMLLERMGAFRDVRVWYLRSHPPGVGIAASATGPDRGVRGPAELIDPSMRRTYIVLTDGASDAWRGGAALDALALWGRHGPVAVLQPLPERLWSRTGLVPRNGRVSAPAPGSANTRLRFEERRRRPRTGAVNFLPVPVLEIDPTWLAAWARLVAGAAATGVDLAISPVRTAGSNEDGREVGVESPDASPGPPQDQIARFRATASPEAYRLATLLAVAPLNLAVMRLVQHLMLPDTGPTPLAEVLLSGLVERTGDEYDFRPGLRDLLLDDLRRSEADQVLAAVSRYLAERSGGPGRAFGAAVLMPGGAELPVSADVLGWLPESVVHRIWGHPPVAAATQPAAPGPAPAPLEEPRWVAELANREPGVDSVQAEVDRLADILRREGRLDVLAVTTRQLMDILRQSQVAVDLHLTGATLIKFHAIGQLGTAALEEATFIGYASFAGVAFSGPANFRDVRFDAGVNFVAARFHADANFTEARFGGFADFGQARFAGRALFDRARFHGEMSVDGAVFAAGYSWINTHTETSVNWEAARVETDDDEDPADEPPVELVPPADAALVARLNVPVRVVDGRPRYHLRACVHLLGRDDEELPLSEAVELGFTPCSVCEPSAQALRQSPFASLTPEEREVCALLADDVTDAAIARRLSRGEKTVTAQVGDIVRKLGAGSRDEAVSLFQGRPPGADLNVSDLDRSVAFYRDVLGLTEIARDSGSAVLASGSTRILLRHVADLPPVNRRTVHLNLEVPDVHAAYENLRAKGVEFINRPRLVNQGEQLVLWSATFRDPDGHAIALSRWEPRQ